MTYEKNVFHHSLCIKPKKMDKPIFYLVSTKLGSL